MPLKSLESAGFASRPKAARREKVSSEGHVADAPASAEDEVSSRHGRDGRRTGDAHPGGLPQRRAIVAGADGRAPPNPRRKGWRILLNAPETHRKRNRNPARPK
ncbi:hypothetical protein GCM10009075_18290 [Sphingomonas trueperi]